MTYFDILSSISDDVIYGFWPALLAAAVGAGISFVGNWWKGRNDRKIADENRDAQRQAWNDQNDYNNPIMQMNRLRQAGLNPHLVYGQSSGGAAGNSSSPRQVSERPSLDSPIPGFMDAIRGFSGVAQQRAQVGLLENQKDLVTSQVAKTNAEVARLGINTARDSFELDKAHTLLNYQVDAARLANENVERNNILLDTRIDNIIADTGLKGQQAYDLSQRVKESKVRVNEILQRIDESKDRLKTSGLQRVNLEIKNESDRLETLLLSSGISKNDPAWLRIAHSVFSGNHPIVKGIAKNFEKSTKKSREKDYGNYWSKRYYSPLR